MGVTLSVRRVDGNGHRFTRVDQHPRYLLDIVADHPKGMLGRMGADLDIRQARGRKDHPIRLPAQALRGPDGPQVQVIGALADVLSGTDVAVDTLGYFADPTIRIISLSMTEAGHGLWREGGRDRQNPVVATDLAGSNNPQGALHLLALGLK